MLLPLECTRPTTSALYSSVENSRFFRRSMDPVFNISLVSTNSGQAQHPLHLSDAEQDAREPEGSDCARSSWAFSIARVSLAGRIGSGTSDLLPQSTRASPCAARSRSPSASRSGDRWRMALVFFKAGLMWLARVRRRRSRPLNCPAHHET